MNAYRKEWPDNRQDFKTVEKDVSLATRSFSTVDLETAKKADSMALTLEEQPLSVNETETSYHHDCSKSKPTYSLCNEGVEIALICEICFYSLLDEAFIPCLYKAELPEKEKINPGYDEELCDYCQDPTGKGTQEQKSLFSENKQGEKVGPLCNQCHEDLIDQGVIPCPFSGFLDPDRDRSLPY